MKIEHSTDILKVKEKKKIIEKKNEREVKVVVRDKMEKLY